MIRDALVQKVSSVLSSLVTLGTLPREDYGRPEITDTKQPEHGDYACNIALVAAKKAGKNPREFADLVADLLRNDPDLVAVEVAGPGFLNLRLKPSFTAEFVGQVLESGERFGTSQAPDPLRINVEFVSVNPNGPITIGSGRGAAYGSTICNVLEAAGNTVHREYYINDGVNSEQMRLFAESVQALVEGRSVPENGYKGDYVHEVAQQAKDADPVDFQLFAQDKMIHAQRTALAAFGVEFDTWFSEQSLHDSGQVERELSVLLGAGVADPSERRVKLKLAKGGKVADVEVEDQVNDEENADAVGNSPTVWLRSTKFGDDMDRVLRRRDGRLTYIASDVAYHWDKFNRPSQGNKLITILGPDHHGYIGRLQAVVAALLLAEGQVSASPGEEPLTEVEAKLFASREERDRCQAALALAKQKLEVQIYQLVRFLKDGKPAPMRKRDGNIYALIDLMREIGVKLHPDAPEEKQLEAGKDVARFFYLMRSHDTTFDFDLDLAEKQSDENPVFYVQYAHARICSVIEKAAAENLKADARTAHRLDHPKELALIRKIADLPWEVRRCAEDYGVHRLTTYSTELARAYHHFYDACRVIQPEDGELSRARLALCEATRVALRSALGLLGISAPERM